MEKILVDNKKIWQFLMVSKQQNKKKNERKSKNLYKKLKPLLIFKNFKKRYVKK